MRRPSHVGAMEPFTCRNTAAHRAQRDPFYQLNNMQTTGICQNGSLSARSRSRYADHEVTLTSPDPFGAESPSRVDAARTVETCRAVSSGNERKKEWFRIRRDSQRPKEQYMGLMRLVLSMAVVLTYQAAAQQIAPSDLPAPVDAADPVLRKELPASPQWIARVYLEAVRHRGFIATADYLHPDEMARFKAMLIPVFEAESKAGGRALMNATFGRDARLADVRLADPTEFLRRFARVMSVRMTERRTDFDELKLLGSVEEGELVHVLVRLRSESQTAAQDRLEVISLLPFEEGWKLIMWPELEAAILAMAPREQDERSVPRLAPQPEPPGSEPRPPVSPKPEARGRRPSSPDDETLTPDRARY